jgi:hypothetical protein
MNYHQINHYLRICKANLILLSSLFDYEEIVVSSNDHLKTMNLIDVFIIDIDKEAMLTHELIQLLFSR